MMAYRDISVGTDTVNYETIFLYIEADYDWIKQAIEPAWVFLNSVVVFFGGDFRNLLILSSLVTLLPVFFIAKKYSANPMLSIFLYYTLYFYFYAFNITRQAIAVNIVLLALIALIRQRKKYFILLVLLASAFHTSALIVLPAIFINKLSSKNSILISGAAISMLIGLLGPSLLLSFIKSTSYATYALNYEVGNFFGNFLNTLIYNSLFLFIVLTIKNKDMRLKLFFTFMILFNLTARIPLGNRLTLYLGIFQIIFYPYYLSSLRSMPPNYRVLIIFMFILVFYTTFYRGFGGGEILPYLNILF